MSGALTAPAEQVRALIRNHIAPETGAEKLARALRLAADAVLELGQDLDAQRRAADPDRLLSYAEVAKRLDVDPSTVGRLKGLKVVRVSSGAPRVRARDLAAFERQRETVIR